MFFFYNVLINTLAIYFFLLIRLRTQASSFESSEALETSEKFRNGNQGETVQYATDLRKKIKHILERTPADQIINEITDLFRGKSELYVLASIKDD
jgi:hypothetical protein